MASHFQVRWGRPERGLMLLNEALMDILATSAGSFDADEPVDNLAHALQCAGLALADGADDELVVAALFHDIGYHARLKRRWDDRAKMADAPAPSLEDLRDIVKRVQVP